MRIYIGFDDTDAPGAGRGTGKLARWFEKKLPSGVKMWAVIRQQLPKLESIPYTSNNSAACVIVDAPDPCVIQEIVESAADHIKEHFIISSDPGLCVVQENSPALTDIVAFGKKACIQVVTQKEAMAVAKNVHLSGHGGTNDGIIGALAGVGLSHYGWSGRFVEFGRLRDLPDKVRVSEIEAIGIRVLPMERDAMVPSGTDVVDTGGWLRPRCWGGQPILPVRSIGNEHWQVLGKKKHPKNDVKPVNPVFPPVHIAEQN